MITPPRLSLRKDERSPAKSVLLRVGARGRFDIQLLKERGVGREMSDGIRGDVPADGQGFESTNMRGYKRKRVVEMGFALVLF